MVLPELREEHLEVLRNRQAAQREGRGLAPESAVVRGIASVGRARRELVPRRRRAPVLAARPFKCHALN